MEKGNIKSKTIIWKYSLRIASLNFKIVLWFYSYTLNVGYFPPLLFFCLSIILSRSRQKNCWCQMFFFKPLYFSEYERVLCVCESRQKSCDPLFGNPHCDDTYIRLQKRLWCTCWWLNDFWIQFQRKRIDVGGNSISIISY